MTFIAPHSSTVGQPLLIVLLIAATLIGFCQPTSAQVFSRREGRSLIGSVLNPGSLRREGQLVDGLPMLTVKDGRLSKMSIRVLPQDEVWLLDGRQCHLCPDRLDSISIERLVGNEWVDDCLETLVTEHLTDKTKATMIYSHGNHTDEDWAVYRGLQFYQNTFGDHGEFRPPVRFVIWSWMSEHDVCRLSSDYKIKSDRAMLVGQALSNVLSQFPDRELVLAGFSLGAQVYLSALMQPQFQQDFDPLKSGRFRVALVAPAMNGCFVSAQLNRYPRSEAVERAVIFDNHADRALRVSKIVNRKQCDNGDVSLGQLATRGNLPMQNIVVLDMADSVGKGHSVDKYTQNIDIQETLRRMLQEASTYETP